MEYLGFCLTRNGTQLVKKVESMVNITPQNNIKEVHAFIGLVKYYR